MASCWWVAGVGKSAAAIVFCPLSVSMWLIRRAVAEVFFCCFSFKLQFKEKPKNEASGRQDGWHAAAQKAIILANIVLFNNSPLFLFVQFSSNFFCCLIACRRPHWGDATKCCVNKWCAAIGF